MKAKVSLTLDAALVAYVDAQPGATRSQKVEDALRRFRTACDDLELRRALAAEQVDDETEAGAWQRAMEEAMWTQSDAVTSGRSRSRRSPSRGRR